MIASMDAAEHRCHRHSARHLPNYSYSAASGSMVNNDILEVV